MSLVEGEDVLTSICRQYLEQSQCPRYMSKEKIYQRYEKLDEYATKFKS